MSFARVGLTALLLAGAPGAGHAAPALEQARALFATNRWGEARELLRSHWSRLAPRERGLAQYVIGRAYAREAELAHWVRRFADEVGLDYLGELSRNDASLDVPWLPLFTGFYELSAGNARSAERALGEAAAAKGLPAAWRERARRRRAGALERLGKGRGKNGLSEQSSHEADYWRLVLHDGPALAEAPPTDEELPWAACVWLRQGRPEQADALLEGFDADRAAAEHRPSPNKALRFYDPLVLEAHERVLREQTVRWLRPRAAGAPGPQAALSSYHAGANLYHLGRSHEARPLLESAAHGAIGARAQGRARVLLAAATLAHGDPPPAELTGLWRSTSSDLDAVLLWADVRPNGFARMEPFATQIGARLRALRPERGSSPDRASVGRWGLARLRAGADPSQMVNLLSRARDNASKNRVEVNDPLLLVAIALASYRNADYPQSLETVHALSEVYPGLRGLHWNLQGTYAARQKAGGEARISQ